MEYDIILNVEYGRLAQLVEHSLDVRVVRDSSSLTSTIYKGSGFLSKAAAFFLSSSSFNSYGRETPIHSFRIFFKVCNNIFEGFFVSHKIKALIFECFQSEIASIALIILGSV